MNWISEFIWHFFFPVMVCSFLFGGGWLTDNVGGYKHKHWTKAQTISGLLIGPAIGFLITGLVMLWSLYGQSFIFERWYIAISFITLAIWLFKKFCKNFFNEEVIRTRVVGIIRTRVKTG